MKGYLWVETCCLEARGSELFVIGNACLDEPSGIPFGQFRLSFGVSLGGYTAVPPNSLQCGRLKWDLSGVARSGLPMAGGMREALCEKSECRMFTFFRSRPLQLQTVCVHTRGSKAGPGLALSVGAFPIDNFPSVGLSCQQKK